MELNDTGTVIFPRSTGLWRLLQVRSETLLGAFLYIHQDTFTDNGVDNESIQPESDVPSPVPDILRSSSSDTWVIAPTPAVSR